MSNQETQAKQKGKEEKGEEEENGKEEKGEEEENGKEEKGEEEENGKEEEKDWSWGQFTGFGLGGILGGGGGSAMMNAVAASPPGPEAGVAALISGSIGAAGGLVAGSGGHAFAHLFDEPAPLWDFRSSVLFSTVITLLLTSILGFASIQYIVENPSAHNLYILSITMISAFIAAGFGGILNHFWQMRLIEPESSD